MLCLSRSPHESQDGCSLQELKQAAHRDWQRSHAWTKLCFCCSQKQAHRCRRFGATASSGTTTTWLPSEIARARPLVIVAGDCSCARQAAAPAIQVNAANRTAVLVMTDISRTTEGSRCWPLWPAHAGHASPSLQDSAA